MTKNLVDALEQQKQNTQQSNPSISGLLGIPLGGQRRVEVSGRNGYVYVRLRSNQNEVIQAYNNQVATAYNLPVNVERQGNRYIVIGVDTKRYDNNYASQSSFVPRHGNSHSFDMETGGGGDVVWVHSRQITPILVVPSGSSGGANVFVNPYTIRNVDGSWRQVGATGTANIIQHNPSSPTGAIIALVYLDTQTGNPQLLVNSGTVFSNTITGSSQITPYIPSLSNPSTQIPLAAVRLITGTSNIVWGNIYDVRQWLQTKESLGPSEKVFFLTSGSAGFSSYDLMTASRPTGSYETYSESVGATGTLLGDWITDSNSPNTDFISDGIYHLHIHAQKTGGTKDARIRYIFSKVNSLGVETQIHISQLSEIIQTSETGIDIESANDEISISPTDRLALKLYAVQEGLGSNPTIKIIVNGDTLSRFEIPAISNQSSISSIAIQDEGSTRGNATTLNFVGPGVQASVSGSVATIDVSGGGGSLNTGVLDQRYLKLDASNDPVSGTVNIAPGNMEGIIIVQHVTGTSSSPALALIRSAPFNTGTYEHYLIELSDPHPIINYKGGTLYHDLSSGRRAVDINPYSRTGTVMFDTNYLITGSFPLLELRNFGVPKFQILPNGTTNIPTGSTYNVGGVEHKHSRWLPWGIYTHFNPLTTNNQQPYSTSLDRTVYFSSWHQEVFVNGTNNSSNYWKIQINRASDGAVIAEVSTQAVSGLALEHLSTTTFLIESAGIADHSLYMYVKKTGAPGNLYMFGPMTEVTY